MHSKFPAIRYKRSKTAKGRDGQPVDLLSVQFQKLCQNARAKLARQGDKTGNDKAIEPVKIR